MHQLKGPKVYNSINLDNGFFNIQTELTRFDLFPVIQILFIRN